MTECKNIEGLLKKKESGNGRSMDPGHHIKESCLPLIHTLDDYINTDTLSLFF